MGDGTNAGRGTDPIFIHGILPRSGTNYLWDLLLLHPDCAAPVEPVHEDLFLDRSDRLMGFVDDVIGAWDPKWGDVTDDVRARLYAALGGGLVRFLQTDPERRLVSKSPSVRHLGRFFTLFPGAHLLLLVRDGRAVTRSAMDTFGWSFERAARAWASAADEIERFRRGDTDTSMRWTLVRYEDLVDDLDATMTGVLRALDLDPDAYDLEAAHALPVRGSSFFFGDGRSSVHWEPVPPGPGFAPADRWRDWDRVALDRFEWLAGKQLRDLGYPMHRSGRSAGERARHLGRDLAWATREALGTVRAGVASASRPLRRRLGSVR